MKIIDGFFMAWGMFLAIPCPVRRWREEARRQMLSCLPLIGGIVGGLWVLIVLLTMSLPVPVRAFLLAVWPWLCTGFLHLDGYMDVCDAVLSRRDLATRQKILKDSHCGAFAVIGVVLLALGQWSVCFDTAHITWLPLLCIPVASRSCAAIAVTKLRPMATSQYTAMEKDISIPWLPILCLILTMLLPILFFGSFSALVTVLVYWLSAFMGFKQLDGMNGDISGFALTLAELFGIAALTLVG